MRTPKFLRNLLQSNNYWNKDSTEFTKANEYLDKLYPGQLQKDASGNYTEPEFDMTYEQFLDAQKKFDDDIADAIQEAQDEDENEGTCIDDYSQFVEVAEQIDVLVLMPWGSIENKKLIIYTLNIPEEPESESDPETTKTLWVWHSEDDEHICDDCAEYDGDIFEDKNDIPDVPLHPNCRCWVEEIKLDDNGKPISSKVYKGQKPETPKDKISPDKAPTFDKPVNTKPGQYAVFDGKKLTIYQDSKQIVSWDAVSGKPGYQSPEYQSKKDTGPIPAGTYVARQEKLQHITPYGLVIGVTNKGTWPGSLYSWGSSRIPLETSKETNTHNRGGFYVHGGWKPGSAGCIDLTSAIDAFAEWFENNGHDLIVTVEY